MYMIRIGISQDGEYTSTFLKDKEGRDIRIGNLEGEIITELQDKLHRRNVLVKDLRKQIEELTKRVDFLKAMAVVRCDICGSKDVEIKCNKCNR